MEIQSSPNRRRQQIRKLLFAATANLVLVGGCSSDAMNSSNEASVAVTTVSTTESPTTSTPEQAVKEFFEKCEDLIGDHEDHEERFFKIAADIPYPHVNKGAVALAMTAEKHYRDAEACGLEDESAAYKGDVEFFSGTSLETFRAWLDCLGRGTDIRICSEAILD